MQNIFLAPRSNETSHENFESTIITGRPYSFVEPYLSEEEKKVLSKYESVKVWGTKEGLKSRWEKMSPGDFVLFYAKGFFNYSARVVLLKHSEELSKKLWPVDENGEPWPCLFFIDNVQEIKISLKVVQELAGYKATWDRVQGFMRMQDEGPQAIVEKFGSIESFLSQKPELYEAIEEIIEKIREEVVEEVIEPIVDHDQLLLEATSYKDSGPSHTFKTGIIKQRIENKTQKVKIAHLEGYACQICNWSTQYINSKGQKVGRIDVDHIIDKAQGGGEEASNLWVLCPNCHVKKTLGVITIDAVARKVFENGEEIKFHHDIHLGW